MERLTNVCTKPTSKDVHFIGKNNIRIHPPKVFYLMTETEVQNLLEKWISKCFSFIEDGNKGEVSKKIKGADRKEIEKKVGGKCPTCPTILIPCEKFGRKPRKGEVQDRASITVEHVVPRTLGGNNTRENLVAMCHQCNMYRNATMTYIIPNYSTMHGISLDKDGKSRVSRFIEWSIRTIHSPDSEKIDTECSIIFDNFVTRARKIKPHDISKKPEIMAIKNSGAEPHNNLGKESIDNLVELLREIHDTQKAILVQLQKSLFRRLIDWMGTPFRILSKKIRSRRETSKSISPSQQNKSYRPPPEKTFVEIIEHLLTDEGKISMINLGIKLRKYQEENNWDDVGSGALLVKSGMGKNFGLKNAILKLMPDKVTITGEHSQVMICLTNGIESVIVKQIHEKPVEVVPFDRDGAYPSIAKLNQSRRGLRLPREPKQLADAIEWFNSNQTELNSFDEVKEGLRNSRTMSPSRAVLQYNKFRWVFFTDPSLESREIDWRNSPSLDSVQICERMKNRLVKGDYSSIGCGPEFVNQIEQYFAVVRQYILPIPQFAFFSDKKESKDTVSPVPTSEGNSKYRLTTNLNSSASGLRLPREPQAFAAILDWYVLGKTNFTDFHDLVHQLKGSGIVPSSRAPHIANKIRRAIFPPGEGKSSELNWNDAPLHSAKDLCDKIMHVCLGKSEWDVPNHSPEFFALTEQYFSQTKELL